MSTLENIFKAYDVRGLVPEQFDSKIAYAVGVGFAQFVLGDSDSTDRPSKVLVARDMRPSGVELVAQFALGVQSQGLDVVDLGLGSTDLLYFAAGSLDAPGAMFTASHNPAQYNGIKFCKSGARPVGEDSGLSQIRRVAEAVLSGEGPANAA
ncbi:MAG: phosphomannomutase/phosphoglucomutase, partial [Actinobacteria bacterium]|nr:phosphomannomutase/phosphoglucomutase [Actinomycetota bacterium]